MAPGRVAYNLFRLLRPQLPTFNYPSRRKRYQVFETSVSVPLSVRVPQKTTMSQLRLSVTPRIVVFSVNVTVNSAFSKCKFLTSLCSASYVAVNTTLCSHLLLSAVLLWMWIERRPRLLQTRRAAVDRYRLPAGPTAANPPHAAERANGTERQTD